MRTPYLVALKAILAALHLSASAQEATLSVLPTSGPVRAQVMQLGMSPDVQRIASKLQAALQSQPAWAKQVLDKAVPGQPLPYHPNFRVTEDEYRSFLAAAERPTLVRVADVNLSVKKQQNGRLLLVTQPPTSKLNGIEISPDAQSVDTPLATLDHVTPISNQDAKGATGRWMGTQWSHEAHSPGRALAVKFSLGKRDDHGDGIIYYDVKDVREGKGDVYYEILLFPAGR